MLTSTECITSILNMMKAENEAYVHTSKMLETPATTKCGNEINDLTMTTNSKVSNSQAMTSISHDCSNNDVIQISVKFDVEEDYYEREEEESFKQQPSHNFVSYNLGNSINITNTANECNLILHESKSESLECRDDANMNIDTAMIHETANTLHVFDVTQNVISCSTLSPPPLPPITVSYTQDIIEPMNWSVASYLQLLRESTCAENTSNKIANTINIRRNKNVLTNSSRIESEMPVERKLEFSKLTCKASSSSSFLLYEKNKEVKDSKSETKLYSNLQETREVVECQREDWHAAPKNVIRSTRALKLRVEASKHKMYQQEIARRNEEKQKEKKEMWAAKTFTATQEKKFKKIANNYIKPTCLSSEERELQKYCTFRPLTDRHSNRLMHCVGRRQTLHLHDHKITKQDKNEESTCQFFNIATNQNVEQPNFVNRKNDAATVELDENMKKLERNVANLESVYTFVEHDVQNDHVNHYNDNGSKKLTNDNIENSIGDTIKQQNNNNNNNNKIYCCNSNYNETVNMELHESTKANYFIRSHSAPIISCTNEPLCKIRTMNYSNGQFYMTPFRGR